MKIWESLRNFSFSDFALVFKEIGASGFLDIAFMSVLIYGVLVWFKKTKVAFVLTGILICSFVYLLAYQFNLFLMSAVFKAFFTVIIVAMIVIFHEELRHFFEQVALFSLNPKLKRKKKIPDLRFEVETLVRTLVDLSREKIGALVVIRGADLILRHLEGGVSLDGEMSEPLLKSLFDPHSIGHDGAMVIERDRVLRFSCHLPLSKDFKKIGSRGTRHAAALGLSELCDALCLVVSEEKGTISAIRHGEIKVMQEISDLTKYLEKFYDEIMPRNEKTDWRDFFRKNYREKVIAFSATLVLWFVLVHESQMISRTYQVPVEPMPLPRNLEVTDLSPEEVVVTFSGPRNAFHFLNEKNIRLSLKLYNPQTGIRTVSISKSDFNYPKDINLEYIDPLRVKVRVEEKDDILRSNEPLSR